MNPLQKRAGMAPGGASGPKGPGAPMGPGVGPEAAAGTVQMFGGGVKSSRGVAMAEARRLLIENKPDEAAVHLKPYVAAAKKDAEAMLLQATVYERKRQLGLAEQMAQKSLKLMEHPATLLLIARCLRVRGESDEAIKLCDRALAKAPGLEMARLIKGGILEEAGRFEDAKGVTGPLFAEAEAKGAIDAALRFEWAKLLVQDKKFDDAIAQIDRVAAEAPQDELRRLSLYLKAKACDRKKDYKGAYEAAAAANEIGRLEFSPELYAEQVTVLMENWSREKMARFPVSGCKSEVPVFVAGMPRSGTSLIDQIIDAHPKAAGVGELATIESFAHQLSAAWDPNKEPPGCFGKFDAYRWTRAAEDYVKEIKGKAAPGVQRIVNKSLGNNKLVGLIARLFPRTRIIHAIRDPRDVAVSCFQGGFNNALHPWTTRYEWIARAWEQSQRMMDHWKKHLDVPILDVHYEKLVKHPETEFPRIIEFLGLEWDAACTKFHESRRTVRTLSYDQVNRPLYTTSAGRNANYAPFMEGIEFPAYDPGV
jgi:tetratricopeptide (TPR) repeat protein